MLQELLARAREVARRPLSWVLLAALLLAIGMMVGSFVVKSDRTTFECTSNDTGTLTCQHKTPRRAELLELLAGATISIVAVPIILKLWFWSGIRAEFQSALGTHKTLLELGITERRPQTTTDWSSIVEVNDGATLSVVAVAGFPLAEESSLTEIARALVARKNTIVRICVRDPQSYTDNMFAPRKSLEGAVETAQRIAQQLHSIKHPTSTVEFGTINQDLKYTLVLGSSTGVYMPHPVHQSENRSAQMINICFRRGGALFRDFLAHDEQYIFSKMTRLVS